MRNRAKFILVTMALVAIVDALVGVYLERELRASMQAGLWTELGRYAATARELLVVSRTGSSPSIDPDDVADRAGAATSARITIVDTSGAVVGDSEFAVSELNGLESHAERPELQEAFASGSGRATRYSRSLDQQMLYSALPADVAGERFAVRAALPVEQVTAAIHRLRWALAVSCLVSVILAALLAALASSLISRTLRSVVTVAQAVAGPRGRGSDEPPSRSLSQMAAELEQALGMLAAERNRFEAVLQTMDQAVVSLDARHRVLTVNRAARQLLHLRDDVEGRTLLEAVRIPALKELVERVEGGGPNAAEFEIPGVGRQVEARATLQENGDLVVVILDVTEIRRLERIRRDFVANVSHELRTPISVIRANTETLLSGALDDEATARPFIEAVLRHADRLGRLVSDLLDISRIEAGRYTLVPAEINVGDLVDHVLDSVEVDATAKGIDLEVDIDPDLSVVADRKALEQILVNLLTNAVKYTGDRGHVTVSAEPWDGDVRIEVIDDGPGVDPAHRERIFERFYRVDPGRSRDMGGTGLGLSIVKHLVEAMEGSVGVKARRPHGSVFWLILPPRPRRAAPVRSEDLPVASDTSM